VVAERPIVPVVARKPPRKKPPEKRRSRRRPAPVAVEPRCYFCGNLLAPTDRIKQFHELMVHESCYQRDLNR
jgi:hypothetical protein